jgi:hypothetical protein
MAPEQASAEAVTAAADLYALGCVLHYLLAGEPVFAGPQAKVLVDHRLATPPPLLERAPEVPEVLASIVDRLLAKDPSDRPTIAEVRNQLGLARLGPAPHRWSPTPTSHLVGREKILRQLDESLDRASEGRPQLVLVSGESGIGKSALLESFTSRAMSRGVLVFSGRCYEREILPFRALDRIIDQLALDLAKRSDPRFTEAIGVAAELFVPLRAALPSWRRARGFDPQLREHAIDAFGSIIALLAEEAPVLFAIDDLQWSDRDSFELLEAVLRRAPLRFMTIALFRHEGAALAEALAPLQTARLSLGPLSHQELAVLAEQVLGDTPAELVHALAEESGGSPFFAMQLLGEHEKGRPLPCIADQLKRKFAKLSAAARRILDLIAACAGPVEAAVLREASGLAPEPIQDALDELLLARLLRPISADQPVYDVYHDRFRKVPYEALDDKEQIHRRLGLAIECSQEKNIDALLWHWSLAGDLAKTKQYTLIAAEDAAAKLAFHHAARLYANVLESDPSDRLEEARRHHRMAELWEYAGDYESAVEALKAASALLVGAPIDRELQHRIGVRLAEDLGKVGRLEESTRAFDAMLAPRGLRLHLNVLDAAIHAVLVSIKVKLLALVPSRWREREATDDDWREIDLHHRIIQALNVVLPAIALESSLRIRALAGKLRGDRARFFTGFIEGVDLSMQLSPSSAEKAAKVFDTIEPVIRDGHGVAGAKMIVEGFRALGVGISGRWRLACEQLARILRSAEEAGLSDRFEMMGFRQAWMLGLYLLNDLGALRALIDAQRSKSGVDLFSYSNAAQLRVGMLLRDGALEEAEQALAEWEPLVPCEPMTLMRFTYEIAAAMVDLARGRPRSTLDRLLRRWTDLRASGWAFAPYVATYWWVSSFDAAAMLQRDGAISRAELRWMAKKAKWVSRRGVAYFQPLGARALSMFHLFGGDRERAVLEARRALVLSEKSELPFIRWLCLHQAQLVGHDSTREEHERLAREHGFDPERAFWV